MNQMFFDCDSPHPTSATAAIVVSRRCFICLQLSILHPPCRRVCGESALSLGIDIELMDRPVLAIRQPNLVDADKTRLRCREQDVGDG